MTARELIESLGVIAEAPDGVKRLRELVLQLAVRGKLVAQDPREESASVLLARNLTVKSRLVGAGEIPRPKASTPIRAEEFLAELPSGWSMARLGEIAHMITKGTTPTTIGFGYLGSGINFVKVESIRDGVVDHSLLDCFIGTDTHAALTRSQLQTGDVLFSIAGTIGKTCVVREVDLPANTNQALAIIRGTGATFATAFLRQMLDSFVAGRVRERARGGAMLNVSLGDLTDLPVPVPPLAEQHRIVAKVDELMAFLDKLEAAKAARDATRTALRDAALAQLRDANGPDEVEVAWGRIAGQMQELFLQPEDVGPLRQAVLQLAVRGRLVRQVEGDEPAGKLLERITDAQTRGLNKSRALPAIDHAGQLFAIPDCWRWTRLDQVCDVRDGTHATPKYVADGVPLVTSKNLSSGKLELANTSKISPTDHFEISKRSNVSPGDVLFAMIGSIGNPVRVDTDVPFSIKNVALFKPFGSALFNFDYLMVYLRLSAQWMRDSAAGGVQQFIALGQLRSYPIPLPPLAEQHRIVAKVDELMAFLDNLETRLKSARELQAAFAAAAVHHLES